MLVTISLISSTLCLTVHTAHWEVSLTLYIIFAGLGDATSSCEIAYTKVGSTCFLNTAISHYILTGGSYGRASLFNIIYLGACMNDRDHFENAMLSSV